MACIEYKYSTSDGEVFSPLSKDDALCGNSNENEFLLLTGAEYTDLTAYVEFKKFDSETYDTAFYGTLSMWVAGIGIGLVLAMLAKLKR